MYARGHAHSLHIPGTLRLALPPQQDVEVGQELGVGVSQVKTGVSFLPLSLGERETVGGADLVLPYLPDVDLVRTHLLSLVGSV